MHTVLQKREGHSRKSEEETLRPHRTPRRLDISQCHLPPGGSSPSKQAPRRGEASSLGQRTRPPRLRQLLELLNFKVPWFLVAVGHCGFPGAGNPEIITPIRYVVL